MYIWPLPVRWPWPSFKVTNTSQAWLICNLQYPGQYLICYMQTWLDGRIMDVIYAHTRFDDLDLDWCMVAVGRQRQKSVLNASATKHAISIEHSTTAGHFFKRVHDLDFASIYMDCPTCFFRYRTRTWALCLCSIGSASRRLFLWHPLGTYSDLCSIALCVAALAS